jgi:hypothetical protein
MFSDVRSRTRKVIEDQTKVVEAGADASLEPVALAELLDKSDMRAKPMAATATLESPRFLTRRNLWVWPVIVAAAAAGTLVLTRRGPFAATNTPAAVAAVPGAADPQGAGTGAAPKTPELIDVALQATPAAAHIFWDDEALSANPTTKRLPKDGSQHTIRVEAAGFVSREVQVTLDRSSNVSLDLQRTPPSAQVLPPPRSNPARGGAHPAAPAPPANAAPAAAAQLPPPAPSPKANCDPPFYLDDQGIRHPKTWCM